MLVTMSIWFDGSMVFLIARGLAGFTNVRLPKPREFRHGSGRVASYLGLVVCVLVLLRTTPVGSSCWASNPAGDRACGQFTHLGDQVILRLCEDRAGDCTKEGYQPYRNGQASEHKHKNELREPRAAEPPRENASGPRAADVIGRKPDTALQESVGLTSGGLTAATLLTIVGATTLALVYNAIAKRRS
jgi:hypothetical protein